MYCSQRFIHHQKVATDSFLLLGQTTPSKFVMRPPWDSERSASFDFTSLKQKKSAIMVLANRKAGGSS
jgi:hypothetical protein